MTGLADLPHAHDDGNYYAEYRKFPRSLSRAYLLQIMVKDTIMAPHPVTVDRVRVIYLVVAEVTIQHSVRFAGLPNHKLNRSFWSALATERGCLLLLVGHAFLFQSPGSILV